MLRCIRFSRISVGSSCLDDTTESANFSLCMCVCVYLFVCLCVVCVCSSRTSELYVYTNGKRLLAIFDFWQARAAYLEEAAHHTDVLRLVSLSLVVLFLLFSSFSYFILFFFVSLFLITLCETRKTADRWRVIVDEFVRYPRP